MDNSSVKRNIQKMRKERKLSQQVVAEKLGVDRSTYRNIEKGETKLLSDNLLQLAAVFDAPVEELLACEPLADGYPRSGNQGKNAWMEECDKLEKEMEALKRENSQLRETIHLLEGRIEDKDEIISLLRRRPYQEND